jgi:phage baseplate assembly protein V
MQDLEQRIKALEAVVNQMVRQGVVSSVNDGAATVRVKIPDADNTVSKELPVLFRKTQDNKDYDLPDVGEQVVCLFLPNGLEQGFVLGSPYSSVDMPPVSNRDKKHYAFSDGTWVEYDRKEHKLTGVIKGDVDLVVDKDVVVDVGNDLTATVGKTASIDAGTSVEITAPVISLEGDVSQVGSGGGQGTETKTADTVQTGSFKLNGSLTVKGNITASGSIQDGAGNSNHHSH